VRQREEPVLRASGQCLSQLHEMVREADYCVMLTDAAGVTIDYRVDHDRRHAFKRAGLYPGSCWSKREEGTCGVATVLLDREPITVHKFDHFRAAFTTLTCSASPIFGLERRSEDQGQSKWHLRHRHSRVLRRSSPDSKD
jgi:sigma-54 dependent transcriptional regulator, acetoin dehydrogenase operon transcriptional activator AcoR